MPDSFDTLIPEARAFLSELSANNSRDWFTANKSRYDIALKTPASHLLDHVAADLQRLTGHPTAAKLFRPHRDLRFSKDKTPYHTHLHMLWTTRTVGPCPPQWFFGISPENVTLGGGIMGFSSAALSEWRTGVAEHGRALALALDTLRQQGARIDPPELTRVPAPHGADHPQADLLRRKSLTVWFDMAALAGGLPHHLLQGFTRLWPLQQDLQRLLAP